MGTPSYFAPEICEDKPYNSKIDVWSMGVVLYELLALAQPFAASNVAALIMKIVNAEPPPLPEPWRDEVREAGTRLTGGASGGMKSMTCKMLRPFGAVWPASVKALFWQPWLHFARKLCSNGHKRNAFNGGNIP